MSKVTGAYGNLCINMFQTLREAKKACKKSIVAQRNIKVCRFVFNLNNWAINSFKTSGLTDGKP